MPAILIRILTWMMTSIAGQVMYSMGVGLVSFTAISSVLSWIQERLITYFLGTSKTILIWINLLDLDYGLSVCLSAFIIRATIMSAQVALSRRG
ncbi:DUF2523 family protein [Acinetobacter baumannii]|uniref:DUF2523 family protein n=1 Tax=Acinetobacter baumannii TaxID=470 RepID=UPI002449725B|nr:DUF2523 family protein [Acinetobacter baumannii]MDH2648681.1 DUF2523 family protein [Acinetobacter baumannii]MDV7648785.1 DUF2523 family protein [Acinetobacter baumannii]MDV7648794.1 DUF2523 family protein [Acinetobacter baumannii]MDV7648803.1 DUF2523 family protein [Acinetobacter baumannii]